MAKNVGRSDAKPPRKNGNGGMASPNTAGTRSGRNEHRQTTGKSHSGTQVTPLGPGSDSRGGKPA